jgi:hypothetical protein
VMSARRQTTPFNPLYVAWGPSQGKSTGATTDF